MNAISPNDSPVTGTTLMDIGPPLCFCAVLFVMIPVGLVFHNLDDIGPVGPYVSASALASMSVLVLWFAAWRVLPERASMAVNRVMLATAAFVYLSDLITPLAMQHLETGLEKPEEPWNQIGLDGLLIGVCAALGTLLARNLMNLLTLVIAVVVLLTQTLIASQAWFGSQDVTTTSAQEIERHEFSGNVYHLVFDSFGGEWWPGSVAQVSQEAAFSDFLYFANTRSNYFATVMSMPSLTTGRIFPGNEASLSDWLARTPGESTLSYAKSVGFRTAAYSVHRGNPTADQNYLDTAISPALVGDLWLLRLVPAFLRDEVFSNGRGPVTRLSEWYQPAPTGDIRSYRSYQQFNKMLAHENRRAPGGEFVFAHLYPPHAPFQLMRDGTYDPDNSSFAEQSLLAVNMMARFLDTLRDQGKYDDALIIFHSDHGTTTPPPEWITAAEPRTRLPGDIHQQIRETDMGGRSGRFVDVRTRALLLVKPPRNRQDKMRRIGQLAQLADVAQLIRSTLDLTRQEDAAEMTIRTLHRKSVTIYNGYRQKNAADGRRVVFGKRFPQGYWSVYGIDEDDVWTIEERLSVNW